MIRSLTENLERSAALHGERVAIEFGETQITYRELWNRANSVARFLRSSGFRAGERVAIALPNSIDYVVAFYGGLLAGAIAVPINTAAKARDIGIWLQHCDAAWLFADMRNTETQGAIAEVGSGPKVVNCAESAGETYDQVFGSSDSPIQSHPDRNQPACILYTSGTTGRPKGVLLGHESLGANCQAIVASLGLTHDDSIVTVLPFYYSYGNSVLHSHLSAGGKLVLEPNFLYPHVVVHKLATTRATGFAGVPSTFALLLSRVDLSQHDLSSLRYVTQAGGPMPQALVDKLRGALPHAKVVLMYGQTEATARLTCLPPDKLDEKRGSVGVAVPGVRVEIRTEEGAAVPSGEVGEVWAHGSSLMLGYWRDEEATRAVLRDGWLRTGDSGFLDREGFLYLKGRRSDIIKVGANRIHPAEVEEVVAEIPEVSEVAVVGIDDEMLGQVIKAFVVLNENANIAAVHVQGYCRERLANYKVPRYVEFVSSLPKTESGKVRRVELQKGV